MIRELFHIVRFLKPILCLYHTTFAFRSFGFGISEFNLHPFTFLMEVQFQQVIVSCLLFPCFKNKVVSGDWFGWTKGEYLFFFPEIMDALVYNLRLKPIFEWRIRSGFIPIRS